MTTSYLRFGSFAIVAAFGCGDPTQDSSAELPGPSSDAAPTTEGALRLLFTTVDGTLQPTGVFPFKDGVHLRTTLAEPGVTIAAGDYAFAVVDGNDALLSEDALACRRIRLTQFARLEEVYAGIDADGAACQHPWGVHDNATLLPRLMPFADVPAAGGVMELTVLVAPVDGIVDGVFPQSAARGTFLVTFPPPPACGDGTVDVEVGEECDDGNTVSFDGCSAVCSIEPCGDGQLDPLAEACDDGNLIDGDGCSADCRLEPVPTVCGDGQIDPDEQCDDGNLTNGDGCTNFCTIEPPPQHCCCGDGIVNAGESCDDGNVHDGDGCSATCQLDP